MCQILDFVVQPLFEHTNSNLYFPSISDKLLSDVKSTVHKATLHLNSSNSNYDINRPGTNQIVFKSYVRALNIPPSTCMSFCVGFTVP